jgi:hypothetical protein
MEGIERMERGWTDGQFQKEKLCECRNSRQRSNIYPCETLCTVRPKGALISATLGLIIFTSFSISVNPISDHNLDIT